VSEGVKRPLDRALPIAETIVKFIRPVCSRVEIAGSIRREKSEVSDIEIVAIPNYSVDLFGTQFYSAAVVGEVLRNCGFKMDKDGENYKKFFYVSGQIWVDLFLTTPEQWGLIFMLRTGSSDFSRLMVTSRQQGGYMPSYLKVKEGRVWTAYNVIETPEEINVFNAWDMEFVEPKDRTGFHTY
jgi:DNA polymerase/3'-5' exonuclease PolX